MENLSNNSNNPFGKRTDSSINENKRTLESGFNKADGVVDPAQNRLNDSFKNKTQQAGRISTDYIINNPGQSLVVACFTGLLIGLLISAFRN